VIVELVALYSTIPPVIHAALAASSRGNRRMRLALFWCNGGRGWEWTIAN
jgi:hypothetical protein